jgi:hypothetical protein
MASPCQESSLLQSHKAMHPARPPSPPSRKLPRAVAAPALRTATVRAAQLTWWHGAARATPVIRVQSVFNHLHACCPAAIAPHRTRGFTPHRPAQMVPDKSRSLAWLGLLMPAGPQGLHVSHPQLDELASFARGPPRIYR